MIFSAEIDKILEKITSVTAKIHVIRLSGMQNYDQIRKELGPLKDYTKKKWNANFDKAYIRHFPKLMLIVNVNPKCHRYFPHCYIEVFPRGSLSAKAHKDFLIWLNESLPDLKVSQVEYALDLFCSEPNDVESLFKAILKGLYIPYQKKSNFLGGQSTFPEIGKRYNKVYRIGDKFKIYERGRDQMKKKYGWTFCHIDRVRLEHTAKGYTLKNNKIISLDAFVRDPKFLKINFNKWQFKFFLNEKLPAPYENYSPDCENRRTGTFISEHIKARHEIKNIAQYVFNSSEFIDLDFKLKYAMAEFDDRWKAGNG